jgi:hypothetical protein
VALACYSWPGIQPGMHAGLWRPIEPVLRVLLDDDELE